MPTKEKSILQNFAEATRHEWLETNGLGGWSGSTIIGANTRRYHGLLVAAVVPPVERMALLSKLDESIITKDNRYELATNDYGNATHPNGLRFLTRFSKELFPEFFYEAGGVKLKKTIGMIHGQNTVVVSYHVLTAEQPFTLELVPLISGRGSHSLQRANDRINTRGVFENNIFSVKAYEETPTVFIKVPGSKYQENPNWFYNFNYSVEQYRGLDFTEDLFSHGQFTVELKQGDILDIIISTDNPAEKDAGDLLSRESHRRQLLINDHPEDELFQQLVLAADQFIVQRAVKDSSGTTIEAATIIAGYPWFTDWSRDTMIALPGLCLSTGRYEDAKKIISAFAHSVSMGMLPNRFQDNGRAPEYNNVDGTLWYFVAVYKYLKATNDRDFVINEILPVLKDIIDGHFRGTRYNIHVDEDGLLYAGETGLQLTWMDAKIGDWVVTPRMGKPVEIQALWYNALRIFAELLEWNGQPQDSHIVNISADKAKKSFTEKFWYAEGNYLYDVIDEIGQPDNTLRPNQLFAISLPFALIDGEQAKEVLAIVEKELYTPVGLRTLPKNDSHYVHNPGGDVYARDASYHQGTVWSWLLGPFVDTLAKVKNQKPELEKVISNFAYHMNEGCIGSVAEIFDADPPYHPRGCVAQAWGVAEVLRVITDYKLFEDVKLKDPEVVMETAEA